MRKAKWILGVVVLAAAVAWTVADRERSAEQREQEQRERFEREWRLIMEELSRTRPGEYDTVLHYPENWDDVVR